MDARLFGGDDQKRYILEVSGQTGTLFRFLVRGGTPLGFTTKKGYDLEIYDKSGYTLEFYGRKRVNST